MRTPWRCRWRYCPIAELDNDPDYANANTGSPLEAGSRAAREKAMTLERRGRDTTAAALFPTSVSAEPGRDLGTGSVMQPRGTVLRTERMDCAIAWDKRVVDVEVELFECLPQLRVLTDLRTDRDQIAGRRLNEVPMWRNLGNEQRRRIGDGGTNQH
jgi:hypothetical protein